MSHVIGDPRKAGESGPAGDQRKAGEAGVAGDPRQAGEAERRAARQSGTTRKPESTKAKGRRATATEPDEATE